MAGTSDIKSDIEGWKAGSGRVEVIPRSNEKVHISRIGRKELDPFVGPLMDSDAMAEARCWSGEVLVGSQEASYGLATLTRLERRTLGFGLS